ncbi:MAG: hypothetical protein K0R78_2579 [Pelosinus sp.]|jgi:hypothetical protein|nr:hypothetical protein [Pelosinus sp.]
MWKYYIFTCLLLTYATNKMEKISTFLQKNDDQLVIIRITYALKQ